MMEERRFNHSCSFEDGVAEIVALPQDLRDFLGGTLEIKTCAAPTDVNYPSYSWSISLGDHVVPCHLDIGLLRHVHADGGMPKVIKFILVEMQAMIEGLVLESRKDRAA